MFVVRDGKAHRTPVTLGLDDGKLVEVRSGLEAESLVAIQARVLTDGASVKTPAGEAKR